MVNTSQSAILGVGGNKFRLICGFRAKFTNRKYVYMLSQVQAEIRTRVQHCYVLYKILPVVKSSACKHTHTADVIVT